MQKFIKTVEKEWDNLTRETEDFFWNKLEEIEEKLIKLSGGEKKKFDIYYKKKSLDIQDVNVYDLLEDVFKFEKDMKIKIKEISMAKEKEVINAEVVDETRKELVDEKSLAIARKKEALLTKQEMPMSEWREVVDALYKSGYFKDIQSIAQAITKAEAGRELGFPPFYSLQNFFILPGKPPASSGQVMAALIKRSGYDYRVVKSDDSICTIKFFGLKGEEIGESSFTFAEADKVVMKTQYGDKKLTAKDNWKNYRSDMIFWRAMARGARRYCHDAIAGLYLRDEIDFEDNEEVKENSDLSAFKIEPSKIEKAESAKPAGKTREEKLSDLVNEFGKPKVKALKEKMKIEQSLKEISDEDFEKFTEGLKKPVEKSPELPLDKKPEETKPEPEKIAEEKKPEEEKKTKTKKEKVKEMTKEEKQAKVGELKTKYGADKMRDVKEKLKIAGKLSEIADLDFIAYERELAKEEI